MSHRNIEHELACMRHELACLSKRAICIEEMVEEVLCLLKKDAKVVGLGVEFDSPVQRSSVMAKKCKCEVIKKSAHKMAAGGDMKATADQVVILDNEDCTFTVMGKNAAGNPVPLDPALVALDPPPTSADQSVFTLDPPIGVTDKIHALKAGPSALGIDAKWLDGSTGPFHIDFPDFKITAGGATGLLVDFGVPVPR